MDNIDSICKLIGSTYSQQASNSITSREKLISELLVKRRCPLNGWDEINIDLLIHRLSMMDSNNFLHNCGIGERESRFLSPMVARRHFNMGHGIGRSGDISEIQPKAAGSSLINILANSLVLDILKKNGIPNTKSALIVPLATGMSLTLCLLTFKASRPDAKFVIWPRIDQKSCFKSIITAGFVPLIVENVKKGDSLTTDINEVTRLIEKHGSNSIVAIMSTTSCFAPRIPDDLVALGKIAQSHNIPHVVNNAYGMASTKCMSLIEQASRSGRVDVYIQSTDKNFLVPVGGAIIAGFEPSIINKISSNYPGRGSAVPSLDVLITILNLGLNGYSKYLQDRRVQMDYLVNQLKILASKFGEKVLETQANKISVAMTLDNFVKPDGKETAIGSMLFIRGISGARVISKNCPTKEISGYKFVAWCSHSNDYGHSYLTAAAAIGVTKDDIDVFIKRLQCLLSDLYNKKS
ncbi:O-phosphoseryl-tRNA(Sec) selenium transferase-like [Tetranychus urticae]|uniref:O-phosphoseryl-tRNA(Sec) selenium transferase-like n=1 Tax=Tetranychus urticae TaxID=32264 RepID=UPI000D64DC79|nr:O-phosphoseryl-tRNA(Sec) selenium transferase-like [Tetranychus urticae]